MKISCDIIKDLLPLYHDNVCSEDSKIIIKEHLKNCSQCQKYINNMNTNIFSNISNEDEEKIKLNSLKSLKSKLRKKNIITSIVSIMITAALLLGGYFIVFTYKIPIEYKDGFLDITLSNDGLIDVMPKENNYYSSYALTKTIEKNGVKENVAYVYYTDTIWTKYLSNKKNTKGHGFTLENSIITQERTEEQPIVSTEKISAVYYLIGDYTKMALMSNEEFAKSSKDAVLLWQR